MITNLKRLTQAGIAICSLIIGSQPSAGLIINTTNDSFIDDTTGLEWMDFGINDHLSYNQVVAQLDLTFKGWMLPSEKEVFELWANAFSGKGSSYDNEYSSGLAYASYSDGTNQELHFDVMAIMGYNHIDFGRSYKGSFVGRSSGWFPNSTGGLSTAYNEGHQNGQSENYIYGRGLTADYNNELPFIDAYLGTSTMLIRKIPEPSTLTIFAIGLIGLSVRRFKK